MPIIKLDKAKELEKVKFLISSSILTEIKEYCKWASIDEGDIGVFFEQAAEFILKKDHEWKKHKKDKS
jgi:hypothetical protein